MAYAKKGSIKGDRGTLIYEGLVEPVTDPDTLMLYLIMDRIQGQKEIPEPDDLVIPPSGKVYRVNAVAEDAATNPDAKVSLRETGIDLKGPAGDSAEPYKTVAKSFELVSQNGFTVEAYLQRSGFAGEPEAGTSGPESFVQMHVQCILPRTESSVAPFRVEFGDKFLFGDEFSCYRGLNPFGSGVDQYGSDSNIVKVALSAYGSPRDGAGYGLPQSGLAFLEVLPDRFNAFEVIDVNSLLPMLSNSGNNAMRCMYGGIWWHATNHIS